MAGGRWTPHMLRELKAVEDGHLETEGDRVGV